MYIKPCSNEKGGKFLNLKFIFVERSLVNKGPKIAVKIIKIKKIDKMWGLGTPEDLDYFQKNFKGVI